ncbi:MAG: transglycosylase domain-containing protein [Tissierellia bacterium]|nr:transglycosylase domain-containing protein [Tissierellia bacterium]
MKSDLNKSPSAKQPLRWSSALKIVLLTLLILGVLLVGLSGSYVFTLVKQAPPIDPTTMRDKMFETSKIYDNQGQLVETLVLNEFSEYVPIEKIPKDMQMAAIAIEDERFMDHRGMDFRRILSSALENVKQGRIAAGASTIPMQLSKNLYTSSEQSLSRKIRDIYYAFQIEDKLSKEEILEAYLNSAGFSKGTVGVQAAAKTFFDKDVSELNLAESAMIVGATNRPSTYTPYHITKIDPQDDLEEISLILMPSETLQEEAEDYEIEMAADLEEMGKIDQYDLMQIEAGDILIRKAMANPESKKRQELILWKMAKLGMISEAEKEAAINTPIHIKVGQRGVQGYSSYYVDAVKEEVTALLLSKGYSPEEAQDMLYNGGLKIETPWDLKLQETLEEVTSNPKYYSGRYTDDKGIPQPQVGSVLMDQERGAVLALVGGRSIGGNNILNRAKNPRQPGSSIKPISPYMTYLNEGGTAGDVFRDLPLQSRRYKFRNSTGYRGYTTVRKLVTYSSNVGAYLVGASLSPDEDKANAMMMDTLVDLGVTSLVTTDDNKLYNDQGFAATTLGGMTYGISPLEMAGAYATIANEGNFIQPSFINKIESSNGEVLYENPRTEKRVTSKQNAYILTSMLEDVVARGTGTYANIPNMHQAGKTGTTSKKRDSWFVGFTPYYTLSVWIGNDDNTPLSDHSRMAARLWRSIMIDLHEGLEDKAFEKPDGLYTKYIPVAGYYEIFADNTAASNLKDLYKNIPKEKEEDKDKDKKDENKDSSQNSNNNSGNNSGDTSGDSQSSQGEETGQ